MYEPNIKSSLFNFDPAIAALVLWVLSIVGVNAFGAILLILACVVILKFETQSEFLRNHVSQLLALSIVSFLFSMITLSLGGPFFIFGIFRSLIWLLNIVIGLIIFAFALLGALKAYSKQAIDLPIIGFIGTKLNDVIKPD